MDIRFVIPILNPALFLQVFIAILGNLVYSILIYDAIDNNREEYKFSKLMIISSLIFLCFNLSLFFIPSISVSNLNPAEQIIVNLIYTIYDLLTYIPFMVLQGLTLIIFGWYNKIHYNNYLLIGGILITVNIIWSFISLLLLRFDLINLTNPNNLLTIFYFQSNRILFVALNILFYVSFLIHGITHTQTKFRNLAIIMLIVFIGTAIVTPYTVYLPTFY